MSEERLQTLLETLKRQGLETGEALGREITEAARREADEIVGRARAEAGVIREKARHEAELETRRVNSALSVAASKFVNHLKLMIEDNLLREPLREEIEATLGRPEFVRELIVDFVRRFAASNEGEEFQVMAAPGMAADIREAVRSFLADRLEQSGGVAVIEDTGLKYGFSVVVKDGALGLDFSDDAFLEGFLSFFSPEFRHFFDGFQGPSGEAS